MKIIPLTKKGQTGGLITGLVMGVAALVIGVIIALVITSTLGNAGLLTSGRSSKTISNETEGYINASGYTLDQVGGDNVTFTIIRIYNATPTAVAILVGNYTLDSTTGILTNASNTNFGSVNITYTHQIKSNEELAEEKMSGNFSAGINNVSGKIPTVLLIAAIVLILGVMVFLVAQWQRMRLGGGGTSL